MNITATRTDAKLLVPPTSGKLSMSDKVRINVFLNKLDDRSADLNGGEVKSVHPGRIIQFSYASDGKKWAYNVPVSALNPKQVDELIALAPKGITVTDNPAFNLRYHQKIVLLAYADPKDFVFLTHFEGKNLLVDLKENERNSDIVRAKIHPKEKGQGKGIYAKYVYPTSDLERMALLQIIAEINRKGEDAYAITSAKDLPGHSHLAIQLHGLYGPLAVEGKTSITNQAVRPTNIVLETITKKDIAVLRNLGSMFLKPQPAQNIPGESG